MSEFLTPEQIIDNPIPTDASQMTHKQAQQLIKMARAAGVDLGNARETREKRERWAKNQAQSGSELQKSDMA